MRQILPLVWVFILALTLVACGQAETAHDVDSAGDTNIIDDESETAVDSETPNDIEPREENGGTEIDQEADDARNEPPPGATDDSGNKKVEQIRETIQIGTGKEHIRETFGAPNAVVQSVLDNGEVWRYDLAAQDGYYFAAELDIPDLDGLGSEELAMQLMIYWNHDGAVSGYSLYEATGEQDVTVYHLLADGTEKEEKIQNGSS